MCFFDIVIKLGYKVSDKFDKEKAESANTRNECFVIPLVPFAERQNYIYEISR